MSGPKNPPMHCIQIVRLDAQKIFHTSTYMGKKSVYADNEKFCPEKQLQNLF